VTEEATDSVPVWTLSTEEETSVPEIIDTDVMTPARLSELRTALATLAASPIATLEAYPIAARRDRSGGIALHAASPLAQQLTQLLSRTAGTIPKVNLVPSGDVLYRMVVPAKVAAQVGKGLVRPMAAKGTVDGIRSALVGSKGIAAHSTFFPVAGRVASGAAISPGAAAGAAVASAGVITVAAPLVLMAVAVGVSAYADHQRQKAIERITELLEELHEDKLDDERSELDGCRDAIDKATSILLDQGRLGLSLGLDSAVHAIGAAIERSRRRLTKWEFALSSLPDGAVDLDVLVKAFPGITGSGGRFRAHLELARLAIALKRRVLVLQAVEHAQADGAVNPFKSFIRSLQDDERRVDELESGLTSLLVHLSTLELKRPGGIRPLLTQGEVENLLRAVYRLRAMADETSVHTQHSDVAIEIERTRDGSVVVFPATAA
jgi:hypothetical protein